MYPIKKMQNLIFNKIKEHIDVFPNLPTFDHSYWKGYCRRTEEVEGYGRNDLWTPVKLMAIKYCDELRSGKAIAGIAKIKKS